MIMMMTTILSFSMKIKLNKVITLLSTILSQPTILIYYQLKTYQTNHMIKLICPQQVSIVKGDNLLTINIFEELVILKRNEVIIKSHLNGKIYLRFWEK